MDVKDVLAKYSKKIGNEMNSENKQDVSGVSRDYQKFKQELLPEFSRYERWVKTFGKMIKLKVSAKDDKIIRKKLQTAHLEVEPGEVVGFALMSFIILMFLGTLLTTGIWFIEGTTLLEYPVFFLFLILVMSMFVFYYYYTMPTRLALKWKLKASSQMVPAVLYTVIYMKHTSNLERAISFVSQHIEAPLALDFKKILWDVQTGRFSNIKDSLDNYLDFWKDSNIEFVESFHLIESSLYEPSEARRIQILERSLKVILDGVYERMLKYTHSIKSPLTNLYMLGIVLPTLGLALLPLASTLLGGAIKTYHVFVGFNIIIPFFVFYLVSQVLLKRPGGYGQSDILQKNPNYGDYTSKRPYWIASFICVPLFLIGITPLIFGYTPIPEWFGWPTDFQLPGFLSTLATNAFGFIDVAGEKVGPFSAFALLLGFLVPFSVSLFFIISFRMRTKNLIKSRNDTRDLEKEFNSSLFTLGNRLGDGTPAEVAFAKVAQSTKGQKTSDFFRIVNTNIQSMGMSIETAIFDPRRGALIFYPSNLIGTSMRILIESAKKGLKVAAQSLMSISEYVRNIQKINERLRDLLADVVSDMRSNMTFLAPLLAGIVVGLTAMITGILSQLKELTEGGAEGAITGLGNLGTITQLFNVENMIPPYQMQIAIGIYIIEIIFILTGALVTIDAGEDKLRNTYEIGRSLMRGSMLYLIMAFISVVALSLLASIALRGIG
jgi:ribosomal protein L28